MTRRAPDLRSVGVELGLTVLAPALVLWLLTAPLGPARALLLALAFPLIQGLRDVWRWGRPSGIALLAFVSIAITGGVGLLDLDARWIAVKEALIPGAFAIVTAGSVLTGKPALGVLFAQVLDREAVDAALGDQRGAWDRVVRAGTLALAGLFLASAAASAVLAWVIVGSPAGTPDFNSELARLGMLGLPLITLPMVVGMVVVLRRMLTRLEALTGKDAETLMITNREG